MIVPLVAETPDFTLKTLVKYLFNKTNFFHIFFSKSESYKKIIWRFDIKYAIENIFDLFYKGHLFQIISILR